MEIDDNIVDDDNEMGAQAANILASGLRGNVTLKELEISHMELVPSRQNSRFIEMTTQISKAGWRAILVALHSSKCRLEKLSLNNNGWIGASILSLPSALYNHATTLKMLNLRGTYINRSHFAIFFQFLQDPKSVLEDLDLSYTHIADIGLYSLATALEGNKKLQELYLIGNPGITEAGWEAFSTVLRDSNSALEKLDLRVCGIKVNAIISIANSLANNIRLKELGLELDDRGSQQMVNQNLTATVVTEGTTLFSSILCNKSSILSTYNSNHTLTALWNKCTVQLPNDLKDLLAINKENSVSQAARLKIINTHFSGRQIKMQPFTDMDVSVRAHALAWKARDQYLFHFLRAMPSLLEKVVSKKRTIGMVVV
jgi:hypothetical protein